MISSHFAQTDQLLKLTNNHRNMIQPESQFRIEPRQTKRNKKRKAIAINPQKNGTRYNSSHLYYVAGFKMG